MDPNQLWHGRSGVRRQSLVIWLSLGGILTTRLSLVSNIHVPNHHTSSPHASKIQSTNPCVSSVQSTNPLLAWTNCALKTRPIHAPKLLTVRAAITSRQGIPREREDKVRTDAYIVSSSTHPSEYSGSLHAHTPAAISSRKRALNVEEAEREGDRDF